MNTSLVSILLSLALLCTFQADSKGGDTFQLFVSSRIFPKERLSAEKRQLIHDSISLTQLVQTLGPGWVSPDEGVGVIAWFFDNDTLYVLPETYHPEEIVTFKGVGGRSRMWWASSIQNPRQ